MRHDRSRSPFGSSASSSAGGLSGLLSSLHPPEWMVDELQNRVVLFINHVVIQEPVARERLRRQKGKPVRMQWGTIHLTLAATAAGLVERVPAADRADLTVTLNQSSPLEIARALLSGDKPGVDIQGDVQLAAEVAWLADNVHWDVEEDLSRFIGDPAAHTLVRAAQTMAWGLRDFLGRISRRPTASEAAAATDAMQAPSGSGDRRDE